MRTMPEGRICSWVVSDTKDRCPTKLSIYNETDFCSIHGSMVADLKLTAEPEKPKPGAPTAEEIKANTERVLSVIKAHTAGPFKIKHIDYRLPDLDNRVITRALSRLKRAGVLDIVDHDWTASTKAGRYAVWELVERIPAEQEAML